MSTILEHVRQVFNQTGQRELSINDLWRKLQKMPYSSAKMSEEKVREALEHYKALNVVYIDENQHVVIL